MLEIAVIIGSFTVFKPVEAQEEHVTRMLDQVIAWSGALSVLRSRSGTRA